MELRQLRYFTAVAEAANFGRAAEQVHIAQPALSRQIRNLELELGVSLFDRLPRGVRLTAAGRCLLDEAARLLADAEGARERVRRTAEGRIGRLAIGFNETVSWHGIVPKSLRAFRDQYPDVTLSMMPANSVDQVAALREGRLDAGFLFNRSAEDTDLVGIPVLVDRILLALPDCWPLANHPPKRLAELNDRDFIWFPRRVSPDYYDRVIQACRDGGLTMRVVQEGENESSMLVFVAVGTGCTFVPHSARYRKPESVSVVPLEDLTLTVTLELVWRADNVSPTLRRFLDIVAEAVEPR